MSMRRNNMTEGHSDQVPEHAAKKSISRRDFLRIGGAAAVASGVGLVIGPKLMGGPNTKANGGTGVRYAMVVDLDRCLGCRSCMLACKVENNTPQGMTWMYVFRLETGTYPNVQWSFMPRPCQHCHHPPCVKVCPVGARYQREDGIVAMNRDRCIGCRFCQTACPYRVNYFHWKDPDKNRYYNWKGDDGDDIRSLMGNYSLPYENPDLKEKYGEEQRHIAGAGHTKGVMAKCTFCVHRVERGLLPACVVNCPAQVYHFGDINDPDSDVSKLLMERRHFRLLEEHGTEPSVYYLGGAPPSIVNDRQLDPIVGEV
jgi:molybdopterin-containing oxidoreductase family iron-sulfur binding subunit